MKITQITIGYSFNDHQEEKRGLPNYSSQTKGSFLGGSFSLTADLDKNDDYHKCYEELAEDARRKLAELKDIDAEWLRKGKKK